MLREIGPPGIQNALHLLHKVVSLIYTPSTTYPFTISKHTGMTVSQVAYEVLNTGLIEMQKLDAHGYGAGQIRPHPNVHKVVRRVYMPMTVGIHPYLSIPFHHPRIYFS